MSRRCCRVIRRCGSARTGCGGAAASPSSLGSVISLVYPSPAVAPIELTQIDIACTATTQRGSAIHTGAECIK